MRPRLQKIRRQVFTEVAKVAFESENINDDIEAIPYRITPSDVPLYRDSIYRGGGGGRGGRAWGGCPSPPKVSRYILPVD